MGTIMSNLTIPVVADPFNTPLAVNPNGDPPNFEGGPTLQPAVLATGVMFIPISMIIVTIRLVMSLRSSKRFHCDDYLCLAGEICGIAYWTVLYKFMANTFKHPWDVPVSIVTPELLKAHAAAQTLNGVAHAFIKASIPTLFIRLFGTLRWLRITSYCLIGVAILANLIPALSLLVVCTSTSFEDWDLFLLHTCSASTEPQSTVSSVFSVAFDITVVAIPTFITSRLNLGREKKLGLMVVFLFGLLVVAASIAGLGYRIALQIDMSDYLWTDTNIAITSYMEIFGTAIVCCAPSLRAFWVTFSSDIRLCCRISSRRRTSNGTKGAAVYQDSTYVQGVPFEYPLEPEWRRYPEEHLYTPASTEGLVDQPVPLYTLQKSTTFTHNVAHEGVYPSV